MNIKEQIKDFITFEDETSIIYPWATKADNITESQINKASEKLQSIGYDENTNVDTEDIYDALYEVLGVNPALMS